MAKLVWGKQGDRLYETGLDRGVLYPRQTHGVPWNGLISVNESVSGGEVTPFYYDGVKYYDFIAAEDFEATLSAYSAPEEFAGCDGSKEVAPGLFATQQPRYPFGLSYRTLIGNDLEGTDHGYKLHLVYNATAAPSARNYETLKDSAVPGTRQWNIHTVPPLTADIRPTAHFVVDSRRTDPPRLKRLEDILYGTTSTSPSLPTQETVIQTLSY